MRSNRGSVSAAGRHVVQLGRIPDLKGPHLVHRLHRSRPHFQKLSARRLPFAPLIAQTKQSRSICGAKDGHVRLAGLSAGCAPESAARRASPSWPATPSRVFVRRHRRTDRVAAAAWFPGTDRSAGAQPSDSIASSMSHLPRQILQFRQRRPDCRPRFWAARFARCFSAQSFFPISGICS